MTWGYLLGTRGGDAGRCCRETQHGEQVTRLNYGDSIVKADLAPSWRPVLRVAAGEALHWL